MKFTLTMRDIGMSGVVRAPQFGLPRKPPKLTVREIQVNKRKVTQGELEEMARLLQEKPSA